MSQFESAAMNQLSESPEVIGSTDDSQRSSSNAVEVNGKKVELNFNFNAHLNIKNLDIPALRKDFEEFDVFVPEAEVWKQGDVEELQAWSDGKRSDPRQFKIDPNEEQSHTMGIIQAIYNTKIKVFLADIPHPDSVNAQDAPIVRQYCELIEQRDAFDEKFVAAWQEGRFADALECIRLFSQFYAQAQAVRERYIAEKLQAFIDTTTIEPRSSRLRVLVQIGSAHTPLYHRLKRERPDIESSARFPGSLHRYEYLAATLRGYGFGKDVPDLALARTMIAAEVKDFLRLSIYTSEESVLSGVSGFLASAFSMEEIQEICEKKFQREMLLEDALVAKGLVEFPFTKEVFENLVTRYRANERRRFGRESQ